MTVPSVLFVCLGNICRSPTAEAIFRKKVATFWPQMTIDSAGTAAWHVGKAPDARAIVAGQRCGYDLSSLRARQVTVQDLRRFDFVLAMDADNLRHLESLAAAAQPAGATLQRFLDFAPAQPQRDVPDPYYGGEQGFAEVIALIEQASDGLIQHIRSRLHG